MSARAEFLALLRAGLRGAPQGTVDEVIAEYGAHFDEGKAANRGEQEIALALGDPLALAEELRMELRIARWQAAPSPRSALQLVTGMIGRGVLNAALSFFVLPLLLSLALVVVLAVAALAVGGLWMLFAGASLGIPGGSGVVVLSAGGLFFAAVALAALAALAGQLLANLLAGHARLRYKFLPRLSG